MISRCTLRLGIWLFILAAFLQVTENQLHAQQRNFGPYESDSARVVLMHFDQNVEIDHNARYTIPDANIFGNFSFLEMKGAGNLGHQVRFDNDSPEDQSHIRIPDTAALDLTGSWTIELWVNLFCFGCFQGKFEHTPFLLKPAFDTSEANPSYNRVNYRTAYSADGTQVQSQYYSEKLQKLFTVKTPDLHIGEWYHLTFIRDTSANMLIQLVHKNSVDPGRLPAANNDSLALVYSDIIQYAEQQETAAPVTGNLPLYIGGTPREDVTITYLDGFMDELRISNVVRNFALPPAVTNVSKYNIQPADTVTRISADVRSLRNSTVSEVILNYRLNQEDWKTVVMKNVANNTFAADIPAQHRPGKLKYRITAKNTNGLVTHNPASSHGKKNAYEFLLRKDSTKLLHLNFNQASNGALPLDQSAYQLTVNADGPLHYGEGFLGSGDKAITFYGKDSTRIAIPSKLLSPEGPYTVDFRFKITSLAEDEPGANEMSMISKGIVGPGIAEYDISLLDALDDTTRNRLASSFAYRSDEGMHLYYQDDLITEAIIKPHTWYRAVMIMKGQPELGVYRVRDSTKLYGEKLNSWGRGPLRGDKPVYLNYRRRLDSVMIDEVKIFNFIPKKSPYSLITSTRGKEQQVPESIQLKDNYPNPFNPTTQIEFSLPQATDVRLTVFDVLGRRVATLVDGKHRAGEHSVTFDASGLSSGMYIYRLQTDDFSKSRKMLLVK